MDHNTDQDDSPKSTVVPIDDDALEAVTGGDGKGARFAHSRVVPVGR
jgi:hypothetical protein